MNYDMHGIMDISFKSEPVETGVLHCGIKKGVLKLPETWAVKGELVAVGENYGYLHCFSGDGNYIGIYKSEDENHIYQKILKLNTSKGE